MGPERAGRAKWWISLRRVRGSHQKELSRKGPITSPAPHR